MKRHRIGALSRFARVRHRRSSTGVVLAVPGLPTPALTSSVSPEAVIGQTRDILCADDLIAVTMVSVEVKPIAALVFSEEKSTEITQLLHQIPADLDLVDASNFFDRDSSAHRLWRLFGSELGIGWVTDGKLLARKRPHLVPVYDSVVKKAVRGGDSYWQPLSRALALTACGYTVTSAAFGTCPESGKTSRSPASSTSSSGWTTSSVPHRPYDREQIDGFRLLPRGQQP